jgi:1-deoxy-D-xylulose-5-phosphate reductoisomerase
LVANRRRLAILGSTGTIGRLTLDVVDRQDRRFEVTSLAGWSNAELLAEQIKRFSPDRAAVGSRAVASELRERTRGVWNGEIAVGLAGICELASSDCDIVVNGLVGAAGLEPSLAALKSGATLALANKESLVIGGELLQKVAEEGGGCILPIDSEHSGLLQCLQGRPAGEIRRVILTASGGPFRTLPIEKIAEARVEEALRHPTWKMGPRITIDSATLLNKGFEVIEAHWLFKLPGERIDVWIHPQSLVHALVEWVDGSLAAQISATDMRLPIQFALCYPERAGTNLGRCDLTQVGTLEFGAVEPERYPCLELARRALAMGGTAPAVLNAADEILVAAFLEGRIGFGDIWRHLERLLGEHRPQHVVDLETVRRADLIAREQARRLVESA